MLFNLKFDIVKSKKQATFVFEKEKISASLGKYRNEVDIKIYDEEKNTYEK